MSVTIVVTWLTYGLILLLISRWASSGNALLPGRVGVFVQAFAYMATYISAVALVGFGGLCHKYGLQMLLVAAGNVWLGTWFVYRYLAWPTRLFQRKYDAHTPAQLLARAYGAPTLQVFLGAISAILLIAYGSAVFKGAALVVAGVLPIHVNTALITLVFVVGLSVMWGGLRGVLYTEALQGLIMMLGVCALLFSLFKVLGGPIQGLRQLAELAPTASANRGFLSLSSGREGVNILSMALVTSVGIWAQPQLIQRHFALASRSEARRVAPLAMLALVLVVGGMYFAGALSRLLLGADVASTDDVVPMLVHMLLPEAGQQIFALAVVSASLSTLSALLHIASGSIWKDVFRVGAESARSKFVWRLTVGGCVAACGIFALKSSSIIALICTTSWSLLASACIVPYLSLLLWGAKFTGASAFASSVGGVAGCVLWYAFGYEQTAAKLSGVLLLPGFPGMIPPILIGTLCSAVCFLIPYLCRKEIFQNAREKA